MNINIDGKLLEFVCEYKQFLFWKGVTHVSHSLSSWKL